MAGESYRQTQRPWWFVAIFGALIVVGGTTVGTAEAGLVIGSVVAVAVVLLTLFWGLTVVVADGELRLAFGLGLIHRRIPVARIAAVAKVRNAWWYGFGIRLTPGGWMWNMSGLDAVELAYKDGKCFRVGTADPDGLLRALEAAMAEGR
ncbi:MAG TPA: hypothetical protein VGC54_08810 [Planctomycetota bacterium]